MEELSQIDFNSAPVWLIAIVVTLTLLPRLIKEFAVFIPPLAAYFEAQDRRREQREVAQSERNNVRLHHEVETEQVAQAQQIKIQDRMLTMLQETLDKLFEDREATLTRLGEVRDEIAHLSHIVARNTDVTTAAVTLLGGNVEDGGYSTNDE